MIRPFFAFGSGVAIVVVATTSCSSSGLTGATSDHDASPTLDGATSEPDATAVAVDAAESGAPQANVTFTVPPSGVAVSVSTASGNTVSFGFPASAAGKTIALTAADPTSIGWTASDFADVIRMEPDGTQFADPVIVRPSVGGVMLATFPTSPQKTSPQWLQLSPDGQGALLHHFSSLAVVPASCPYTSQRNASSCAAGGTELRQDCALAQLCSNVTVSCCVDPSSTANSCDFGASNLQFGATAVGGPSYCPQVDGGQVDGGQDASMDDGAADSAVSDTSVGQDSATTADSATEASASDSSTAQDSASAGDSAADATSSDASDSGGDSAPPADAHAYDSGVNGNCGSLSYTTGNLGPNGCIVSRTDGTATIYMMCMGASSTSCQCYTNDSSHPYGPAFDIGSSPCGGQGQLAEQQMIVNCGCP
jgi:hypothetical protein